MWRHRRNQGTNEARRRDTNVYFIALYGLVTTCKKYEIVVSFVANYLCADFKLAFLYLVLHKDIQTGKKYQNATGEGMKSALPMSYAIISICMPFTCCPIGVNWSRPSHIIGPGPWLYMALALHKIRFKTFSWIKHLIFTIIRRA